MKPTFVLTLIALLLAPLAVLHAAEFKFTPEHEAAVNRERRIFSQYDPAADIHKKGGFGEEMDIVMR
jgi:hypothetical protein